MLGKTIVRLIQWGLTLPYVAGLLYLTWVFVDLENLGELQVPDLYVLSVGGLTIAVAVVAIVAGFVGRAIVGEQVSLD